jgi:hypothetical protein
MINVITVHWMSDKWVPAQLAYLKRNMNAPYRVVASLNGIDDPSIRRMFDHAEDVDGDHPEKLDILAGMVLEGAAPTDVLIFLDGDAFPVQPLYPWLEAALEKHSLVAVQRRENCEDRRPHPSFCATTAKFWKESGASWGVKPWTSSAGVEFSDAGGLLAATLRERGTDWLPLVRTNTNNPHPLWFAVYGHHVYHHGAGFRRRVSKVDEKNTRGLAQVHSIWSDPSLGQLGVALKRRPTTILRTRPHHARTIVKAARRTVLQRFKRRFDANADSESEQVFARVMSDERFYREFESTLS